MFLPVIPPVFDQANTTKKTQQTKNATKKTDRMKPVHGEVIIVYSNKTIKSFLYL